MILDLMWALAAAIILAGLSLVLKAPREAAQRWSLGLIRRFKLRVYLQRRENLARAIDRIAVELAQHRCDLEGNPDDKFYSDWYQWFKGEPDADVDYRRKQMRDRERLDRGEFRHQA